MINIEPLCAKAHRISVYAEFEQTDAEALSAFAAEAAAAGRRGNLLIDLTSFADFSLSAVKEELVHLPTLLKWIYGLDRIAIIADEKWMRTAARFESALLPGIAYQVFDDDEADAALAWVLEEAEHPHTGAFREIDSGRADIAAFELCGRLDRAESERGIAMVRTRLDDPDCARLMIVIRKWHGFEADTVFSKAVISGKLDLIGKLDRYAIVGGPEWIRNMASVISALVKPEIRCFELEDEAGALAWLKE